MRDSRLIGRFAALIVFAALVSAPAALAASVDPTTSQANPQCSDYGLSGLKIDRMPKNGDYSNADLTVTIANATNSSFDWSSTETLDKVLVKSGVNTTNIYSYDPESSGDTSLTTATGQDTSHVEFCYDEDVPPP